MGSQYCSQHVHAAFVSVTGEAEPEGLKCLENIKYLAGPISVDLLTVKKPEIRIALFGDLHRHWSLSGPWPRSRNTKKWGRRFDCGPSA